MPVKQSSHPARSNATRVLNGLVGDLLERGTEARGRNAHFTLRGAAG